ncbi:MAG: tRNA (cytidine(34)-2'-O)-methyltransferase [Planctomycetota bacterium]
MAKSPLFHLALFEPEIAPNTGNAARISAAYEVPLHIVGEPAFGMSDKALRRAGLDYWDAVQLFRQASVWHLLESAGNRRLVAVTTQGETALSQFTFQPDDVLAFGSESRGLPPEIHRDFGAARLRIDQPGPIRSLNLATAVGIVAWEAWRQLSAPNRQDQASASDPDSR